MPNDKYGPKLRFSEEIHSKKHRLNGESFREAMSRIADALSDNDEHFHQFRDILLDQRFLPAGRIQASVGSPRKTTAFNCFVSGTIPDSATGIMQAATEAFQTMRMGGGIGYNFGTLRPKGDLIVSLDSKASGPVSFMEIFNSICKTVASAGHRRGAQMAVLPVSHPDIEEFIEAKNNTDRLTAFNTSVAVTDEFMLAVQNDTAFPLKFGQRVYKEVNARVLWNKIMRSTWDWAEPGILFIDTINRMNNLGYCETIAATNPCAEQSLPPYGACLLGSFNLVKYVNLGDDGERYFDYQLFGHDIPIVVRAMDNVVDRTMYPLPEQEQEAKNKRRMGLGYTGLANALEACGQVYGSGGALTMHESIANQLANEAYLASAKLAGEKGTFPLYDSKKYLQSPFIQRLDSHVQDAIREHGIRNSHLTSVAPTGTISLTADNVSSGCEPVFSYQYDRTVINENGEAEIETISDYGYRVFGVKGKSTADCTIDDHLNVLAIATKWVDSAVSKTINVGDNVSWDDFKEIYMKAWKLGCKGCTTFRASGKRYGILNTTPTVQTDEPKACYYDASTGKKECE